MPNESVVEPDYHNFTSNSTVINNVLTESLSPRKKNINNLTIRRTNVGLGGALPTNSTGMISTSSIVNASNNNDTSNSIIAPNPAVATTTNNPNNRIMNISNYDVGNLGNMKTSNTMTTSNFTPQPQLSQLRTTASRMFGKQSNSSIRRHVPKDVNLEDYIDEVHDTEYDLGVLNNNNGDYYDEDDDRSMFYYRSNNRNSLINNNNINNRTSLYPIDSEEYTHNQYQPEFDLRGRRIFTEDSYGEEPQIHSHLGSRVIPNNVAAATATTTTTGTNNKNNSTKINNSTSYGGIINTNFKKGNKGKKTKADGSIRTSLTTISTMNSMTNSTTKSAATDAGDEDEGESREAEQEYLARYYNSNAADNDKKKKNGNVNSNIDDGSGFSKNIPVQSFNGISEPKPTSNRNYHYHYNSTPEGNIARDVNGLIGKSNPRAFSNNNNKTLNGLDVDFDDEVTPLTRSASQLVYDTYSNKTANGGHNKNKKKRSSLTIFNQPAQQYYDHINTNTKPNVNIASVAAPSSPTYSPHNYFNHRRQRRDMIWYKLRNFIYFSFVIMSLLVVGFVSGFLLASNKDLNDFEIISMDNVLVSLDEIVFDITTQAFNEGMFTISVDTVELDIFAESKYISDNFITIDGAPKSMIETILLGTVYKLETPLEFRGGFWKKNYDMSISSVKLKSPGQQDTPSSPDDGDENEGNKTVILRSPSGMNLVDDNDSDNKQKYGKWKNIIKNEFTLIVRGNVYYKVPFISSEKSVGVQKSTVVYPKIL
ncbi:uncharacterized protein SCODWIG_03302 [Saccharomycodes ludwigii]|uniref:Vacuolar segregation protein 7 n=1 Tax=Saccharomycodes ludwigii TaxID=36035 RepID=A0A376BAB3_9ASCO|nr:uncharacterized protein SCODWIG_03302 [Saccharomycodes ludwigii]